MCFKLPALKCKRQVPLFRASAWLFYEITSAFISALAPFPSFPARLQRHALRQEQGEEAHSRLRPRWAGRPGLHIFKQAPLSLEAGLRGVLPLGAGRKLHCILGML